MTIHDVLHDLVEHSPAYTSAANREEAHQAIDDALASVPAAQCTLPADLTPDQRVAEIDALQARLAELIQPES